MVLSAVMPGLVLLFNQLFFCPATWSTQRRKAWYMMSLERDSLLYPAALKGPTRLFHGMRRISDLKAECYNNIIAKMHSISCRISLKYDKISPKNRREPPFRFLNLQQMIRCVPHCNTAPQNIRLNTIWMNLKNIEPSISNGIGTENLNFLWF